MCYGDVDHGKDGYYRERLEEEQRQREEEEGGGYNIAPGNLMEGSALNVEPLPDWMFNGTPTKVKELSTGSIYDVVSSGYDKYEKGTIVTIKKNGEFVDLDPDNYQIVERISKPIPGFSE